MVYTKTGDKGTTSLVGGTRVPKYDLRVEAYGTVDELNSHIGVLAEMIKELCPEDYLFLKKVQNKLFVMQTLLATEGGEMEGLPMILASDVAEMEHSIDLIQERLPKLKNFVIPGGSLAGAQAHVCRTVCRRAERRIVELQSQMPVADQVECYTNRLSDYLFVLSRKLVLAEGKEESLYIA